MSEKQNYTVEVSLEVRAESPEHALNVVAEAIRKEYGQGGIAPVASYKVYPKHVFGASE